MFPYNPCMRGKIHYHKVKALATSVYHEGVLSYRLEETVDDASVQHVNVLAVNTLPNNTQCRIL